MTFNVEKCAVMRLGKSNNQNQYQLGGNGTFRRTASSQRDDSKKNRFEEWTIRRMDDSKNGRFEEWTFRRMDDSKNRPFFESSILRNVHSNSSNSTILRLVEN